MGRIGEILREEGPRALWWRGLATVAYRRVTILVTNAEPRSARPAPEGLEMARIGLRELEEYRRLRPDTPEEVRRRLAAGQVCVLARLDGEPVACRWYSLGRAEIPHLGFAFELPDDLAYVRDAFTAPRVRRRGVSAPLRAHGEALMRELGARGFLAAVMQENAPGMALTLDAGFTPVGHVAVVRLPRRRLLLRGGQPPHLGAAHPLTVPWSAPPSSPQPAGGRAAFRPRADLGPRNEWTRRRAYWDRVAESIEPGSYPLWRLQSDVANRRLVERWLPPDRSTAVLKTDLFDEIAGEGLYELLARRFSNVSGIDVSQAVVEAVQERHPHLEARVADVLSLPFEDDSFGAVVSNSTLDHLESREEVLAALNELRRVVRPGGRLLITLDNPLNPLIRLREALPERASRAVRDAPYSSGWTCGAAELAEMLAEADLEPQEMTSLVHFPRVIAARLDRLGRRESSRARWQRIFLACERLAGIPTRHLTGHFIAALACRPGERASPTGRAVDEERQETGTR